MKRERYIETNPCDESWKKMEPVDGGKFCEVCQTKVYDLTNLSDQEIENFKGKGYCVQLRTKQVDDFRYVHPLKRFAIAAFFVFGTSLFNVGYSQEPTSAVFAESIDSCNVTGILFRKGSDFPAVGMLMNFKVNNRISFVETDENGVFNVWLPKRAKVEFWCAGFKERRHFKTKNKTVIELGAVKFKMTRIRIMRGSF